MEQMPKAGAFWMSIAFMSFCLYYNLLYPLSGTAHHCRYIKHSGRKGAHST